MLQCVCFGVDGHTGEVVVGWGRCWGVRPVGARAFALLLLQEKAALVVGCTRKQTAGSALAAGPAPTLRGPFIIIIIISRSARRAALTTRATIRYHLSSLNQHDDLTFRCAEVRITSRDARTRTRTQTPCVAVSAACLCGLLLSSVSRPRRCVCVCVVRVPFVSPSVLSACSSVCGVPALRVRLGNDPSLRLPHSSPSLWGLGHS